MSGRHATARAVGLDWLATPVMGGAQQFYCDQESNGGGSVLIGRGRESWSVSTLGSGTPEQVQGAGTGLSAFSPHTETSAANG